MKLTKQEVKEREARKQAYEAQLKEGEDQRKLAAKLEFARKPTGQKLMVYSLRAIGITLALLLLAALLIG